LASGILQRAGAQAAMLAVLFAAGRSYALPSADELVRQARAHEEAHEEDIAARRYTDALMIEANNGAAWIGLAELRYRLGELAEAERVYTAALVRMPTLYLALEGRARCLWALGRHADAEASLQAYADAVGDPSALRALAAWFGVDGRSPAQLATWRRLLAMGTERTDVALSAEARLMVRALAIIVDGADPAASPVDVDPTRRQLARIARAGR
jgi:tetratricopeptide (TPR) repeat protein